jgi:hypothetical protein
VCASLVLGSSTSIMVEIVHTPDPLLSLSPVVPEFSFLLLFLFQQGISNGFFLNGIIAQFSVHF